MECLHEVQDPTLYQMVAEEWGGERLSLGFPSPVACLSAGYLLPRLPYPHIELGYLIDQRIVLFTKGLSNGCVDHQQPRSGIRITLRHLSLHSRDGFQCIVQLLSSSFGISHLVLGFQWSPILPQSLADVLMDNTTREAVGIGIYNRISAEGVVGHLAEALKGNSTLRVLRLDEYVACRCLGPLAVALTVNTTLERLEIGEERWGRQNVPRNLTEKLMSNGVLQQLLTTAIERTVSKFGGEETGRALMTILEEWRDLYNTDVSEDYDSDDSSYESECD